MAGPDGTTAPFHSGPSYVLSSGLARSIFVRDRLHTTFFYAYGSSSEDANMGKWVQYAEQVRGVAVRKVKNNKIAFHPTQGIVPELRPAKKTLDGAEGHRGGAIMDVAGTVVVYSGPTSLKNRLYTDNFEYFLKHGLPSSRHGCSLDVTVIVVLTTTTLKHYATPISQYNASCGEIRTMVREDRCYDMESARTALASGTAFEKLVFLNCGMKGPFQAAQPRGPQIGRAADGSPVYGPLGPATYWAVAFTDRITADVKLSGVTINCGGKLNVRHAHVQSMLWATDRVGLASIQKAGAIYECDDQLSTKHGRDQLIITYELGLSRAVMKEGYAIQDMTNRTFRWADAQAARCPDLWNDRRLVDTYSPETLLFWKMSRAGQAKALSQWLAAEM